VLDGVCGVVDGVVVVLPLLVEPLIPGVLEPGVVESVPAAGVLLEPDP
jgi:hypothetical protein